MQALQLRAITPRKLIRILPSAKRVYLVDKVYVLPNMFYLATTLHFTL